MEERKGKTIYDAIKYFVDHDILTLQEEDQLLEVLETREQKQKHHADFLQLISAVEEDQLKAEEEHEIKQLLLEKKGRSDRKDESFASVVWNAVEQEIEQRNPTESVKKRFHDVFERCFKNSPIARMDVSELTEILVEKLMIDAVKICGRDRLDLEVFMGVLQAGLDESAKRGLLRFVHSDKIYKRYIVIAKSRNYIADVYTQEEIERIKGWIAENPGDIGNLAIRLWFTGDISPEEIIGLKISAIKRDEETGEMEAIQTPESGIYLIMTEERKEIVKSAMALNASYKRMEYLFSVDFGLRWKKLSVQGMAKKLYHICRKLDIEYKSFHLRDVLIESKI